MNKKALTLDDDEAALIVRVRDGNLSMTCAMNVPEDENEAANDAQLIITAFITHYCNKELGDGRLLELLKEAFPEAYKRNMQ